MILADTIERPKPIWWILTLGGLTLLALLAFNEELYRGWVFPLPSPTVLKGIFAAAILAHIAEATYVYREVQRLGLPLSGRAWTLQTLLVGYPSTRLIRQRAKQVADAGIVPAPTPKGGLLGNTLDFKSAPLTSAVKWQREHGDTVRFTIMFQDWYLLSDPEQIHEVLVTQAGKFHKPGIARRLWSEFLGNGVLTAEGETWKRQSKMVRPGFHPERIQAYGKVMVEETNRLLDDWQAGQTRDICADMTAVTLAIVNKTLFDADVRKDAGRVGEAMNTLNHLMLEHIYNPVPVPRWWPSETNRKKVAALDEIDSIVKGLIAERRGSGEDRGDLLSMLVHARDEAGNPMPDRQLRDETMTLFFAGHETTAHALTWMWYLLARHPEVEQRLFAELMQVTGGRPLTVADLPALPYLEMVVKESMRILPSVWSFMRETTEPVRLGNHLLPKGAYIFISPYVLQHDARWFPNPEVFDPERFSTENSKKMNMKAYVPFSNGARICVGKTFAMMEARLVLGTMVQRARAKIPAGYEAELLPQLSLRPKGGLPGVVEMRA